MSDQSAHLRELLPRGRRRGDGRLSILQLLIQLRERRVQLGVAHGDQPQLEQRVRHKQQLGVVVLQHLQ